MAYFAAGVLVGGGATYATATTFRALDAGVSHTYRCDELERQADERDNLRDILSASWVGEDADLAEAMLARSGQLQFRKGDEALVAGRTASGQVSFVLRDGHVHDIEISGIDGRCPPPQGGT